MKKLIFLLIVIVIGVKANAQTDPKERDSVTNTADFQYKVRSATILAAYQILSNAAAQTPAMIRYCQRIISDPQGSWITAMSYGVMTNTAINWDSPMNDIQFQVNSIIGFQANAYYQISPLPSE